MSTTPPAKPPKPQRTVNNTVSTPTASAVEGGEEEEPVVVVTTKKGNDVQEILALDQEDESLRKYKESLLGSAAHGDLGDISDPRRLVIEEFRVVFAPEENLPDIIHSLSNDIGLTKLANEGITFYEGCKFKFRITFRVQHEIIAGIKFVNAMSRMMLSETEELMLGSYPPSSQPHVFEFPKWDYNEAPSGLLHRGKYQVKNSFIDSDKRKHLQFEYGCTIVKRDK